MFVVTSTPTGLIRPSNTTQYAANDVLTDATSSRFVFTGLPALHNEGFLIQSATCVSSAAQATKPDLDLFLFDTDPATLDADNAAWTPTDAEMLTCVGKFSFPVASWVAGDATSGAGGNSMCSSNGIGIGASGNTLYGVLILRNTYTPISAEVFTVRLTVIR